MSAGLLTAVSLLIASIVGAEDKSAPPRNGVSLELPGLLWNGIELVGERFLNPHLSLMLALGGRFAGEADYSASTLSAGVGARFWLNRFRFFSDLGGPCVGVRIDTSWTRISDRQRGTRLQTMTTAVSLRLGYRFLIARRIELTPEAGVAVSMGSDQVPWRVVIPRPAAVLGLTVGYLF